MSFRTDLAMERIPVGDHLPVGVTQWKSTCGQVNFHGVEIENPQGAEVLGKPMGRYITAMIPPFQSVHEIAEEEIESIAAQIRPLLPSEGPLLVVGLGNNDITPDAIGPRTVHQILATRHFSGEATRLAGLGELRAVAALAPGVLGQTGVETAEIIRSLVDGIKPVAVIVIDALAAREVSRLGATIQISDTGISPGSGVQNSRRELSQKTLGVPVICIGIPTVIDAATLTGDLLEGCKLTPEHNRLLEDNRAMMITPREIDVLIGHACKTLALVINKTIHPHLTLEEIGYLAS
jgi:spore protease